MVKQFQLLLVRIGLKRFPLIWSEKRFPVFQVIYYQRTKKTKLTFLIYNNPHGSWRNTLSYNTCHRVDISRLLWNVWLLIFVNIFSKFVTIIGYLRFLRSSSINTSQGESSKFPRSSISIPSSFFSAVTTFSEWLPSSVKPWFSSKLKSLQTSYSILSDIAIFVSLPLSKNLWQR